jgi:23S rRNA (uridine2552-2'-O)-methyltransferase
MTKTEPREQIKDLLNGRNADVVISDMSPDISGNYSIDQARSAWLCECALQAATQLLQPGGRFLCKIFEGEDTKTFIELVKHQFTVVKIFSPEASRKSSSEVYIIAKSFKNPYKKVDVSL